MDFGNKNLVNGGEGLTEHIVSLKWAYIYENPKSFESKRENRHNKKIEKSGD